MYYTVIKHSRHSRTLEKCRKHSPVARVVYISLMFSNAHRVLSQCNTRLRLLYLLNMCVCVWTHVTSKHSEHIYFIENIHEPLNINSNQMTCFLYCKLLFNVKKEVLPSIACGLPAGLNVSERNILICQEKIMIILAFCFLFKHWSL